MIKARLALWLLLSAVSLAQTPAASSLREHAGGARDAMSDLTNIRYITSVWNWAQPGRDDLSLPGTKTIHLSPCPLGIDTESTEHHYRYKVYISGTGTPEAVPVTGGVCTPGAANGTIVVTTANAHAAGYTVGSASSGIQEAWNDAWVNDIGAAPNANSQTAPYVKLMADTKYNVYAPVYLRGRGGILDGAGALIVCSTRDRCIYVGTTFASPGVNYHKLYNLSGTSTVNVDGVQVASVCAGTSCSPSQPNGTYLVTTVTNHPFVAGNNSDTVACEYHSQTADQRWSQVIKSTPTANSFTVSFGRANFAAGAATFGFCNIQNTFIENNSDHVALQDVNIFQSNPVGLGFFSYGIINDNDQQFIIERATNRSSSVLKNSANWPIGAFFYQRTDAGNAGITYIHSSELTNVNCAMGGGNGFVISDTVCQGFPVYGIRYFGGLQPATIQNVYQESTGGTINPLYGYAAQMGLLVQGGFGNRILGTFPIGGLLPVFSSGGSTAAERTYFVVPHSSVFGAGPMWNIGSAEPATGGTNITVQWPSVGLQDYRSHSVGTLTWDVLVTSGTSASVPQGTGNFAIATGISGSCGTNGMCSFTDTQAPPRSYTVPNAQFGAVFWFWPASTAINATTLITDIASDTPGIVATQGSTSVSIIANQCKSFNAARQRSPIWITCLSTENGGGAGTEATVFQQQDSANNGPPANSKGRLNFGRPLNSTDMPNDLITLQDSNFTKTVAAAGERPSNDTGDMAIGLDQSGGLSERASTSISEYIKVRPNGSNYSERLTAVTKIFKVPIATPASTVVLSTLPLLAHLCRTQGVPLMGVTTSSVIKWSYAGSAIGVAGYGTGDLQISTFSTMNMGNVMVCNITGSAITPGAITVNIREEL